MNDRPKTKVSLILRLSKPADAEAWEEFCAIYLPVILRVAQSRGLQDADAYDFSQTVLVRVARSVDRWSPDPHRGTFGAWLATIARNLLVDFLRANKHTPVTVSDSKVERMFDEIADPQSLTDKTGEEVIDDEVQQQLFAWASQKVEPSFHPTTWQAFWRTAVKNESVRSVALDLKMTAGAIYVARSRVIARLRKTIESCTTNPPSAASVASLEHDQ